VTLTTALPQYPTAADLRANIVQAIDDLNSLLTNFNAGGLSGTYIEALCVLMGSDASTIPGSQLEGAYELLNDVRNAAYISTATGEFLDLRCADVGVTRKLATASTTGVIFTSPTPAPSGGITIGIGTIVSAEFADPTKSPQLFQTTTAGTIAAGQTVSNSVTVVAIEAGSGGDVDPGAINLVRTGGLALQVTNPAKATGGTDQEGDDAPNGGLRARGLAAIANASQCTDSAITEDALSYQSIVSAAVADNTADDGVTFMRGRSQLYVDDGSGTLGNPSNPNHTYLVQLQNDVNSGKFRAAGTQLNVVGSTTATITGSLAIDVAQSWINLGNTALSVQNAVQAAIYGVVQASALGHPITLASFIETAKAVPGCSNVIIPSVLINGTAADVVIGPGQVGRCAALSSITVSLNAITPYA
jgi:uncharacterized phage protein gp47/JayE